MKTYAPKGLRGSDLRGLITDLGATPLAVAKFLQVTERSIWRWLAEETAPWPVLALLWHETPHGRHVAALDVGNELVIVKGLARSLTDQATQQAAQLCRVLAISNTGAANDPLLRMPGMGWTGPVQSLVFPAELKPCARASSTQLSKPLFRM